VSYQHQKYGHLISFETTNGLKNAPEVISEGLKIKNVSGGACPRPP